MGKGRISTIKMDVTALSGKSMQSSLAARGRTRFPGTGVTFMPHKELNGKYRTGLDPDASYIENIKDLNERKATKINIKNLKERLETESGFDLGPTSPFWDYTKYSDGDRNHVQLYKLIDGDNWFDFASPYNEINFNWLRVHPRIASSLEAYQNGEYPSDTQFYVYDEEVEDERNFSKKQTINQSIVRLDSMSPENRKRVARLLGLPITDNTKDSRVYNLIDGLLKQSEFKEGQYKGLSTVYMFLQFAEMKQDKLNIKDLVKQAIQFQIYRRKETGKIYEGDTEVSNSEDELVTYMMDDEHQESVIALESKLKAKKLAIT